MTPLAELAADYEAACILLTRLSSWHFLCLCVSMIILLQYFSRVRDLTAAARFRAVVHAVLGSMAFEYVCLSSSAAALSGNLRADAIWQTCKADYIYNMTFCAWKTTYIKAILVIMQTEDWKPILSKNCSGAHMMTTGFPLVCLYTLVLLAQPRPQHDRFCEVHKLVDGELYVIVRDLHAGLVEHGYPAMLKWKSEVMSEECLFPFAEKFPIASEPNQ